MFLTIGPIGLHRISYEFRDSPVFLSFFRDYPLKTLQLGDPFFTVAIVLFDRTSLQTKKTQNKGKANVWESGTTAWNPKHIKSKFASTKLLKRDHRSSQLPRWWNLHPHWEAVVSQKKPDGLGGLVLAMDDYGGCQDVPSSNYTHILNLPPHPG